VNGKTNANLKLWILSLLLAGTTFFSYFRYIVSNDYRIYDQWMYVCYVSTWLLGSLFFAKRNLDIKRNSHFLFALGVVLLNAIYVLIFQTPKYYSTLSFSLQQLFLLLISFWGFLTVDLQRINVVLHCYYLIAFIIGSIFMFLTSVGMIARNQILNENTVGLFLAPFLIYLLITAKGKKRKFIIYVIGGLYLYFSRALTTFASFMFLPIFIWIVYRVRNLRVVYSIYLLIGLVSTYVVAFSDSGFFTKLLSYRNYLWKAYLNQALSSIPNILFGSGNWRVKIGIPRFEGLNAHNTFITIFQYNGIFVLLCYVCLIIFSARKQVTRFTVSDGVLYLAITFQFAESNEPPFTFIFPSLLFFLNLFITKQSEMMVDTMRSSNKMILESNKKSMDSPKKLAVHHYLSVFR
jgi:hypothetical protein